MATWSKQYELLQDIHKITHPKSLTYDTENSASILHDPKFEFYESPVFPGGYYPPKGEMMERLNAAFGNPWNQPKTWRRDGRIEEGMRENDKISDQTVILCLILFLAVVTGLVYMIYRLASNGWCKYRRGRAIHEGNGIHAWGKWIDAVCVTRSGLRHGRYDWDRFGGKRRMHPFPV